MLVRIANRDLCYLSMPFCLATSVPNFRTFTLMMIEMISFSNENVDNINIYS